MRWRIALCIGALVFAGMSCEAADEEPTATIAEELGADEFALSGVVDAKEGVQPPDGIPGEDDLDTGGVGGVAIRPDGPTDAAGLEGCGTTQDAYVTYYTPDTDASDLDDADAWPESLEGSTVTVEGTRHEATDVATTTSSPEISNAADSCVLVLDRIEQTSAAQGTTDDGDDTGTTGGGTGGGGTSSPGATGEPETTADGFGDFPEHEDTDPIFEGTPSPDPCEGAKACEEKRESGEIP
jgi:hypothetical protein